MLIIHVSDIKACSPTHDGEIHPPRFTPNVFLKQENLFVASPHYVAERTRHTANSPAFCPQPETYAAMARDRVNVTWIGSAGNITACATALRERNNLLMRNSENYFGERHYVGKSFYNFS